MRPERRREKEHFGWPSSHVLPEFVYNHTKECGVNSTNRYRRTSCIVVKLLRELREREREREKPSVCSCPRGNELCVYDVRFVQSHDGFGRFWDRGWGWGMKKVAHANSYFEV